MGLSKEPKLWRVKSNESRYDLNNSSEAPFILIPQALQNVATNIPVVQTVTNLISTAANPTQLIKMGDIYYLIIFQPFYTLLQVLKEVN